MEVLLSQVNIIYVKWQMQVIRGNGEALVVFQMILVQYLVNPDPVLLIMTPPHVGSCTPILYMENLYI